jgi:hypothetical protein
MYRTFLKFVAVPLLLCASLGHAEPTGADKAAADALFKEGRSLLKEGKVAEACPKFEESQRYDPSIGTALNLGECYERLNRTASAYGAFGEAERMSLQQNDRTRGAVATERRKALEARLSQVRVQVPGERTPGLEVVLDGKTLSEGVWGTALPVDPGDHTVDARAPGRKPWKKALHIGVGPVTVDVDIPALAPPEAPRPVEAPGWSVQKKVGVGVGAAGVAAVLAGAGVGIAALGKNKASLGECQPEDPTRCNARGVDLRQQAGTLADVSTVTLSVGAALAVGGAVLFLTSKGDHREAPRTSMYLSPVLAPGLWGVRFSMER